jgi:hypothetical protein
MIAWIWWCWPSDRDVRAVTPRVPTLSTVMTALEDIVWRPRSAQRRISQE